MTTLEAEWIVVSGERLAAVRGRPGLDPRSLMGADVEIAGTLYRVTGVETVALVDATGHDFAVRVVPVEQREGK